MRVVPGVREAGVAVVMAVATRCEVSKQKQEGRWRKKKVKDGASNLHRHGKRKGNGKKAMRGEWCRWDKVTGW